MSYIRVVIRRRHTTHACMIDPGDRVLLPHVQPLEQRAHVATHVTVDLTHPWPRINLTLRSGPHTHTIAVHYTEPVIIWR